MADDASTVDVHLGDKQSLDRSGRYLRPVARLPLDGEPEDTHWAVYEWLPQCEAWATGPAICGYSTKQGPLSEGTVVTCHGCETLRPDYERYLSPGYVQEKTAGEKLKAITEATILWRDRTAGDIGLAIALAGILDTDIPEPPATAAVARVRKLHEPMWRGGATTCRECCAPYPCATVGALEGEAA